MADDSQRDRNPRSNNRRSNPKVKTVDILPHPEVLESYDYVIEGSAERILGMFESEQKHRHDWERKALRVHTISTLLGQFLGFGIGIAIFVSAALIGIFGNATIAAFIWVFGLAIVVMAALVWTYAKTIGQRPLFARPGMRQNFRPEKQSNSDR